MSETRSKRDRQVLVRLDDEEHAALVSEAEKRGVSAAAVVRMMIRHLSAWGVKTPARKAARP